MSTARQIGGVRRGPTAASLATADRLEGEAAQARAVRLKDKIELLRAQMQALKAMEAQVAASPMARSR
jgi:hypothetical protein